MPFEIVRSDSVDRDADAFALSEELFLSVKSYIDENYVPDKDLDEHGVSGARGARETALRRKQHRRQELLHSDAMLSPAVECPAESAPAPDLSGLLSETDAGFSETLLRLIDRTGRTDAEIYKRANVDRKLFSKIRNNPQYQPKKATALAFALALELDLAETKELIGRAGYALTHSSKFDIIVEYFIKQENYNVMELNEVLFAFDQPLIGA